MRGVTDCYVLRIPLSTIMCSQSICFILPYIYYGHLHTLSVAMAYHRNAEFVHP